VPHCLRLTAGGGCGRWGAVAKKARLDDTAGAQPMEEDAAAGGHFTEGNVHDLMPLYYRCALASSQRTRLLQWCVGCGEVGPIREHVS